MKIGVLVGAAGLALAGVAYAEEGPANLRTTDDAADAKRTTPKRLADFSDFAAKRDAILGAAGSRKRMVVENEMRALTDAGVVNPMRSLIVLDEDGTGADVGENSLASRRSSLNVSASGNAGGAPGFFEFGQSPPFLTDDFESYKARDLSMGLPTSHDPPGTAFAASNGSIIGQVAPWGPIWDSDGFTPDASDPEHIVIAAADDPNLPADAPLPGPGNQTDGSGSPTGQMLAFLRSFSAVVSQSNNDIDITDNDLVIPTPGLAVVAGFDYYQATRAETFVWVDIVSLQEGFVSVRYFSGGFPNQIGLQGTGIRPRDSSAGAIGRHPIVLGSLRGNFTIGEFYDNGLAIKPDQWNTVAQRLSLSGQSQFHRTPDTDGTNGVLITDRATGTPLTGFENGWTETYPGKPGTCLAGDCLTADAGNPVSYPQDGSAPVAGTYLGTGVGLQQANFTAPQDGEDDQAPLLAAVSHDFFQFHRFNDPDITVVTNFAANDTYYDNLFVTGTRFIPPEPGPDQTLPFIEDLERWIAAPIRLQGGASWFDALSSRAAVIDTDNFTAAPGSALPPKSNAGAPTQSLFLENLGFSAQNTFRTEDTSFYPVAMASPGSDGDFGAGPDGIVGTPDDTAAAADNEPSVSSVMVKLNNTTNVRSFFASGQAFLVHLGTENPGTGATDNRVYVRVPNENFTGTRFDYQDPLNAFDSEIPETLSQNHWRSTAQKALQPDFNDNFWNHEALTVGGGAGSFTVPTGRFFEVRVEIPGNNPENLADGDGNQFFPYKLFVDGVELCPENLNAANGNPTGVGDCTNNTWISPSLSHSSLSFQSGSSTLGLFQSMTIDDIRALGRVRDRGVGPDFVLPYLEDFEGYAVDPDSLSNQGPIDFLRPASVPNSNVPFFENTAAAGSGDVCRYQLIEYLSAAEIPLPGGAPGTVQPSDVIAIVDDLLPPLNPVDDGCRGVLSASGGDFTFLAGATEDFNVGGTQLSRGVFQLLNGVAEPAQVGDIEGFQFDQHRENRWLAGGADSVRLDAPAPPAGVDHGSKTLRVVATSGAADENDFTMSDRDFTLVPESPNPTRPAWVTDFGRVSFDIFFERQPDIPGDPAISALFDAPLQRYSLQVQGIPANGNREDPQLISEVRFGGPDLNPDTLVPSTDIALFFANPDPPNPGEPPEPDFFFESTGVQVPMDQWSRVGFEINRKTGAFQWFLDTTPGEDIFGAGTDAVVVDSPQNPGTSFTAGITRIGSLQYRIGNDEGGNGARTPPKVMIQGARIGQDKDMDMTVDDPTLLPLPVDGMGNPLADPWNAPRPAGATAGPDDWCVYEVNNVTIPGGATPTAPLVQGVDPTSGALDGAPRVLANQDLLAVFRRDPDRSFAPGLTFDTFRTIDRQVVDADVVDAPGANFGGPILPDCPSKTVNGSTDDGYIYLDDSGNEVVRGAWTLEGQPGQAGVNDPFPNGGIRNDAPPYNGGVGDPLPDGSPGTLNEGHRNILLAQFYITPGIGLDIEPQRWFLDNINVTEDCNATGPSELLTVLGDFSTFGPAGLLDVLSTFGSKHPSCP